MPIWSEHEVSVWMAMGLWNHKFQFSSLYLNSSAATVDLLQVYAEIDLGHYHFYMSRCIYIPLGLPFYLGFACK